MLVLSSSLSLPVTASFLTGDPVAVQGPVAGQVLYARCARGSPDPG